MKSRRKIRLVKMMIMRLKDRFVLSQEKFPSQQVALSKCAAHAGDSDRMIPLMASNSRVCESAVPAAVKLTQLHTNTSSLPSCITIELAIHHTIPLFRSTCHLSTRRGQDGEHALLLQLIRVGFCPRAASQAGQSNTQIRILLLLVHTCINNQEAVQAQILLCINKFQVPLRPSLRAPQPPHAPASLPNRHR